jgi:thiol-disulfide isomerase/thioredoxin
MSLVRFVETLLAAIVDHGDLFLPPLFAVGLFGLIVLLRRWTLRPRSRTYWPTLALCVWAIVVSALAFCFERGVRGAIERRVARISLESFADGTVRNLADYRGKVVLLNFWATWCPPCRAEMPDLNRLAEEYRDRGVAVVCASDEPRERVAKFTADHPISAESALFTDAAAAASGTDRMALGGRPTTLVLDRQGRIRRLLIGRRSYEEFAKAVTAYL